MELIKNCIIGVVGIIAKYVQMYNDDETFVKISKHRRRLVLNMNGVERIFVLFTSNELITFC